MAEKIYVNKISVKKSKFGLKMSGNAEEVIKQIREHINEKGYFNWDINERKEVSKYGETHSVTVDTWKPEPSNITKRIDDLPF